MSNPKTLAEHVANHTCSHPGCKLFGPFGTGMKTVRGEPGAHGLRPLGLAPGARWWCAAHWPRAEEATIDLPPLTDPTARPKQRRLL